MKTQPSQLHHHHLHHGGHGRRKRATLLAAAGTAGFLLLAGATPALAQSAVGKSAAQAASMSKDELVARGKYIVSTSGCHDCHTPWHIGPNGPEPDMRRALSGHPQAMVMPPAPKLPEGPWLVVTAATNTAFAGPWGVTFTANLTPDGESGLGKWTAKDFIVTIRTGLRMGRGREILPPMPYPVYNNMTDADLTAVFTYLQSIPAIPNKVPEPRPPAAPMAGKS
ncbi:c-type cytochrome [Comamonadaceae bacterium G21597-S1]|nr:c-type cytochrome [Comamonadaceae bacterium G21597-S1]